MRSLQFDLPAERPCRVLAIGAHPDDIEIGAGGTLLQMASSGRYRVTSLVVTGDEVRHAEAALAARLFLGDSLDELIVSALPDSRLPTVWGEVKDLLERTAARVGADVVIAPRRDDAHQDHRVIADLVPTVWRDNVLLSYEIPKWDGDLGPVSTYVPMDEGTALRKIELLSAAFSSQTDRDWWDQDVFLGLARLRGMECRHRYAEGFTLRSAVLAL